MAIVDTVKAILEAGSDMGKSHHEALSGQGFTKGPSWKGKHMQEHTKQHSSAEAAKSSEGEVHKHLISKGYTQNPKTFAHTTYSHPSGHEATVKHDTRSNAVIVTTNK
jgi:uncharacterized membrane protein